eukprot:scaffold28053_cov112-Isochrysis_galbana.AAC.1
MRDASSRGSTRCRCYRPLRAAANCRRSDVAASAAAASSARRIPATAPSPPLNTTAPTWR